MQRLVRGLFWLYRPCCRRFCQGLLGWGLLLALSTQVHAQAGKVFLWEAADADSSVYLLGSIHVLKSSDYPLPQIFSNAFQRAELVVFEADLDDLNSAGTLLLVQQKAVYPVGRFIYHEISPSLYQLLQAYNTSTGLGSGFFDSFKPWYVSLFIEQAELTRAGYSGAQGVDQYFFNLSKAARKPVQALETAAFQVGVLADAPLASQEKQLEHSLTNRAQFAAEINSLVDLWKKGDLEAMTRLLLENYAHDPEGYARLLTDRNNMWLPQIEMLLAQNQTALIVVGAAHLAGRESVTELLAAKGYSVQQLPAEPRLRPGRFTPSSGFELEFSSQLGLEYELEFSTDLKSWTVLSRVTSTNRSTQVHDSATQAQQQRFYRVKTVH